MIGKPAKIPLSATDSTPFSTPGINSFGIEAPLILFSTSLPLPGSNGSTLSVTFANCPDPPLCFFVLICNFS
jgi:hypothetical protein